MRSPLGRGRQVPDRGQAILNHILYIGQRQRMLSSLFLSGQCWKRFSQAPFGAGTDGPAGRGVTDLIGCSVDTF